LLKGFLVPWLRDGAFRDAVRGTWSGGCYAYLLVIEGEALGVVLEIRSEERGRRGVLDEEVRLSVYEGELVCVLEGVVTGTDVLFPVSSFDVSLLLPVEPGRIQFGPVGCLRGDLSLAISSLMMWSARSVGRSE
jgi:hypothetical protein